MIRIAITPAAYAAIAGTLPRNVGVEREHAENGDIISGSILASWRGEAQGAARARRELQRHHPPGEQRGRRSDNDPLTANKKTRRANVG
jgi:hypothetical protein